MDKYRIGPDDDNDSDDGLNFDFGDSGLGNFDDIEEAYGANNPGDPATAGRSPPTGRNYRSNLSAKGSANFAEALRRKRGPETMSVKKAFADRDLVDLNENLGDDFYKSVWEPPTVALAEQYLANTVYQGGEADLRNASIIEDTQLGMGVSLYFQIAYSLSIALIVMSFLSIPVMLFAFSAGDGVPLRDRDIVGFYRLTLGNIGHDRDSYDYEAEARCSEDGSDKDDICLDVFGQAVSIQQVAMLVTIFEMFQVGIFVITIFHLQRRLHQLQERHRSLGVPSITDYAVYVKNIPPDTTTKELVQHFSAMYQLQDADFRNRKPVEHTAPVDSADYSGNEVVVGTWVADCIIGSKVRKFVKYLHRRKELMYELYKARARVKMYSDRTPHKHGTQPKKVQKAHRHLIRIGNKIDKLNAKVRLTKETAAEDYANEKAKELKDQIAKQAEEDKKRIDGKAAAAVTAEGSRKHDTKIESTKSIQFEEDEYNKYKNVKGAAIKEEEPETASKKEKKVREKRPAMAAFVCFEYNESMARCVDDYELFRFLPKWLFYPSMMKFKGQKLHVVRAPEPDQLLWENLEVSSLRKGCMRLLTAFLSIVFLLILYALLAAAASYRTEYVTEMPSDGLCPRALPFLYTGGYPVDDSEDFVADFQWSRAPMEHREDLDKQCDEVVSGSYYAYYALDGDFSDPAATFNIAACHEDYNNTRSAGLCPSITQTVFCPCLKPYATEKCKSLGCYGNENDDQTLFFLNATTSTNVTLAANSTSTGNNTSVDDDGDDDTGFNNVGFKDECVEFTAGDIPKCYCQSVVDRVVERNGVVGVMSWGFTAISGGWDEDTTECYDALFGYSASTVGIYVMILVVAVANHLLCDWVAYSTKLELHEMLDELHLAVAVKAFLLSFCSMSILILVAFGSSTKSPSYIDGSYIFDGPYSDFSRGWYGSVGFFLVVSFFLITVPPSWYKGCGYCCGFKCAVGRARRDIESLRGEKFVLQQQFNEAFVGRAVDIPLRSGKLLAWILVAMAFAPGLPILMPFCAIGVGSLFRLDRRLLCRYYPKPEQPTSAVGSWMIQMLPLAAVLRLIVGCFMYSSDNIFPNELLSSSEAGGQPMDTDSYKDINENMADSGSSNSPTSLPWVEDRVLRFNTFPLFIFFLVMIFIILLNKIWIYLPFYWIEKVIGYAFKSCCNCVRFRASKDIDYIHPYDLTFGTNDPKRTQEAPMTGGYFKYLRHGNDKPGNFLRDIFFFMKCIIGERCCFVDHVDIQLSNRWEIIEMEDGFHAKILTWAAMVQMDDGSLKMNGDQKTTYDVIKEKHCNSYNIEKIPAYKLAGYALRKEPFGPVNERYVEWKHRIDKKKADEAAKQDMYRKHLEQEIEENRRIEVEMKRKNRFTKKEQLNMANMIRDAQRGAAIASAPDDSGSETESQRAEETPVAVPIPPPTAAPDLAERKSVEEESSEEEEEEESSEEEEEEDGSSDEDSGSDEHDDTAGNSSSEEEDEEEDSDDSEEDSDDDDQKQQQLMLSEVLSNDGQSQV